MIRTNPSGRLHPRAHLDVFVNKIIGDEPHLARVRDISPSGVFLYKLLEPEVAENQPVGLEIMLPNSLEIIWAVAKPARRETDDRAEGIAYQFTRISERDKQTIREYVEVLSGEREEGTAQAA